MRREGSSVTIMIESKEKRKKEIAEITYRPSKPSKRPWAIDHLPYMHSVGASEQQACIKPPDQTCSKPRSSIRQTHLRFPSLASSPAAIMQVRPEDQETQPELEEISTSLARAKQNCIQPSSRTSPPQTPVTFCLTRGTKGRVGKLSITTPCGTKKPAAWIQGVYVVEQSQ